jgi:hypothetical protein
MKDGKEGRKVNTKEGGEGSVIIEEKVMTEGKNIKKKGRKEYKEGRQEKR